MFDIAKIIIKNLFTKPATAMYPFQVRESYANTRGKIVFDAEQCSYCTLCQKKCPTGAISVDRAGKIWHIDPLKCITCNYCVDSCPKKCLNMDNHYTDPVLAVNMAS
ncbi:MAG: 4Fe-4S ferredoxin [Candidatus Margulisiibacteriota bacterium]|nr:MAG: 4Fe-4S ferredoxin [Candidatus Margulisbacteria bacterium GWD2_39_127]OGI03851.1 MAG: 4Fe-4S ferredoxin [Candidatus Margulisbacteria bacterium GWF2_38_17]OGI06410.1 MAG: 4Fe-4S ferredoxin [Candidatus Margulisbacteria bacterium GWE2_39_32]PZM79407.1 MAG: 4Fe-4S ferredoxin [Candidatus Margulisiibacteriota bacterium]HAR63542.1 4Fe-4S ferredoxin [Candidatus Margulisiibacteriota bacterium]